eukprot:gene9276-10879_t
MTSEKSPLVSSERADHSLDDSLDYSPGSLPAPKFVPIPAFWNTVKAFAGAGSFSLPYLLEEQLGTDQAPPSYADLARRAYGRYGELFVCFMNFLVTMSICIAYLLLIGQNFAAVVNWNHIYIIWCILPIILCLTFLTDMKYLGFTSIVGAFSLMLAMTTVIVYGIKDNSIHPIADYTFDYKKIPGYVGTAAFFFCNHIVVVPISHASGDPKRYPRVLDFAMVFITVINVAFALVAYLYFNFSPNGIQSNIVENLPNGTFANIVRICVVFELACSFPIVCGAGLNVVESSIAIYRKHFTAFPEEGEEKRFLSRNWKFYAVRVVIVSILAGFASAINNFGAFLSLIGSLMLAVAGFVIPPLLSLSFFPEQSRTWKVIHIIIVVFGVAITILGSYQSIDGFIHPSSSGNSTSNNSTTNSTASPVASFYTLLQ